MWRAPVIGSRPAQVAANFRMHCMRRSSPPPPPAARRLHLHHRHLSLPHAADEGLLPGPRPAPPAALS